MPFARLIPCLDVAGGRVVKGVRFRNLVDVGDPLELAAAYSDAGADELVLLDIEATVQDRAPMLELIAGVADNTSIPFTVGGGVRDAGDAERLLAAGADKVAVNSAALARPALVTEIADLLGAQAVVVAIDSSNGEVFARSGGTPAARSPVEWAREAQERGAGEILLTSIDTDGTQSGYDLPTTRAVAEAVTVPVIASGGAGSAAHVASALRFSQAALLASLLHNDPNRLRALRAELQGLGVRLRHVT
jgi:cyclase